MKIAVFYSWQSDTPATAGRQFIQAALAVAVEGVAANTSLVVRPELDHDTKNVPGSPPIVSAILTKIDECSVFVADVSQTYKRLDDESHRMAPNPNVLLELGYALKRLGPSRVILVQDATRGGPDSLPFDLRGNRVLTYSRGTSPSDAEAARAHLTINLQQALHLILTTVGPPKDILPLVAIDLAFSERSRSQDRHEYRLPVWVTNTGDEILTDWTVEIRFPRALLEPRNTYPEVRTEEGGRYVVMRRKEVDHSGPLYPRDRKETLGIDYYMDHQLYDRRKDLFKQQAQVWFYVGTKLVATASRTVEQLQHF